MYGRRCSVYFAPLPFFRKLAVADIAICVLQRSEMLRNVVKLKINFDTQIAGEKFYKIFFVQTNLILLPSNTKDRIVYTLLVRFYFLKNVMGKF